MNAPFLAGIAWLAAFSAPSLPTGPLLAGPPTASAAAPADELRRERVPADVDLVVHFDFEGFKQTELWKHVAATMEKEHFDANLDLGELREFEQRFGIDPLRDLRAMTLYKVEGQEEPTVVLFSTTPAIDAALRAFQQEPGYARTTSAGIELHTWSEDTPHGDKVFAYVHSGANDERVVVLAGDEPSAVHAARVLRGQDPSHASAGSLLTLAPARGSYLYVAAKDIPHIEDTPASQVFGLAQGIQIDLGEAGGYLRMHMGVATASPDDAVNISGVVNGLISLARLAGGELGEEVLELLTGVRLSTHGNQFAFDFEFEVARLIEIARSLEGMEELIDDPDPDEDEDVQRPQEREGGNRRIK